MWRSPEELVGLGFERSRVVMINEFHNGYLRCIRTREVGCRILPAAHDAAVRHLAMETLNPQFSEESNRSRHTSLIEMGMPLSFRSTTPWSSIIHAQRTGLQRWHCRSRQP